MRRQAIDLDALRDALPHGSGINDTWTFETRSDGSVRCSNSWHAMNDAGCYCGWIPFAFTARIASDPEAGKGPVVVAGNVRGAFKTNTRANLYLDDLADDLGTMIDHALHQAGSSLVRPATETERAS